MAVLRSRLLRTEGGRRSARNTPPRAASQIGTGDRSERIRTYNFPQNRVTDHRIGLTLYRIDGVMEGDLDEFTEALAAEDRRKQLAAAGGE